METDISMFDTEQAAKRMNVHPRTVQKLAARGLIQFETVRKDGVDRRLYNGADIEKVMASRKDGFVILPKAKRLEPAADTSRDLVRVQQAEASASIPAGIVEHLVAKVSSSFEKVLEMLLTERREERQDARERWELDRQDRLQRRKLARRPAPPTQRGRKTRAAGA